MEKPLLQTVALFIVFSIMAIVLHSPGFQAGMIFDSKLWINDNARIFDSGLIEVVRIFPPRALFMASLYADYLVNGMNPSHFRLMGCLYLAAAGTVVVLLSFLLFRIRRGGGELTSQEKVACVFVGLLFLVHPLQIFTVLYIWQRSVIMACLLYFAALAVYLAARMGRFKHPMVGYFWVGVLFLLGILTKESIGSLPAALLLAEAVLFGQGLRELLRRAFSIALICVPPVVVYLTCTYLLHSGESVLPQSLSDRFLADYRSTDLSPAEILLTEARVVFFYLYMIVAPWFSGIHLMKAVEISQSLWNPPSTAAACAGLVSLAGAGILLIRKSPVVSFCLLFFLLTLMPEAVLIPKWLFFGYRPILAMFGVLFLIVLGASLLISRLERRLSPVVVRMTALCVSVLAVCLPAVQTWSEASEWNPMTFWKKAFVALPVEDVKTDKVSYSMVVLHYSDELIKRGNFAEAAAILPKALSMTPTWAALNTNLGIATEALGDSSGAAELYRKAINLEPGRFEPYQNLGAVLMKMKDFNGAAEQFEKAVSLKPGNARTHANLGFALLAQGNTKEAISRLETAVRLDGSLASVHLRLGTAYERLGEMNNAFNSYAAAFEANPKMVEAHLAYARLAAKSGNQPLAVRHYEKVLALAPGNLSAHDDLGRIFAAASEFCKAKEYFQKLYKMRPDFPDVQRNLEDSTQKCDAEKQAEK